MVIAMTVTGQAFTPEQSIELRRYILNKRRDGGWGLYVFLSDPSSRVLIIDTRPQLQQHSEP